MKVAAALTTSLAASLYATAAWGAPVVLDDAQLNQVVAGEDFIIVNKVADQASAGAPTTDPLLINPWGLSQAPGGSLWVANEDTGTSTIYDFSTFAKVPLNVTIPGVEDEPGNPTGTTFTTFDGDNFRITKNGVTAHSLFLFDSLDGTISGWSPLVDPTHAVIAVDRSDDGAGFTGLTIRNAGASSRLYAADFANNRVEMYNGQFKRVGTFTDPSLPDGYAPFNVQTLNDKVYVAFALREEEEGEPEEVVGAGLGYVVVFDTNGTKLKTLVSNGPLNAPWGLTIAPASFGKFAGALLVGNFGDGKINAFDPATGQFLGTLQKNDNGPIEIEGLWALRPGPNGSVVFSAGPDDEAHGLVGVIRPAWLKASWADQSHVKLSRAK